jgi:hypothetical protein
MGRMAVVLGVLLAALGYWRLAARLEAEQLRETDWPLDHDFATAAPETPAGS